MHLGIRELRRQLPAAVRRAGTGERLVVTVGGHPVAALVPLDGGSGPTLDDLVAVRALQPPRVRTRPAAPEPLDVPVDARTDRALREIR